MYGKSASAGGASMTPSSVACVCAVIEVMRIRLPAAARLIAGHETGALARPTAVGHAVLEVAVALLPAYPASAMSKERTVLLRIPQLLRRGRRGSSGRPPGDCRIGRRRPAGG